MDYEHYNWHLSPVNPLDFQVQTHNGPCRFPILDIHQSIHLNIFLAGELECTIRNGKFSFRSGDFNLISPWEIHGNTISSEGFQLYNLTIHPDFLMNSLLCGQELLQNLLLTEPDKRKTCLMHPEMAGSRNELLQFLRETEKLQGHYVQSRQWLAIEKFFIDLLDFLERHDQHSPVRRSGIYQKLHPALKKLYSHPGAMSLCQAAAECFLSPDYFSHLFKECFGISYTSYALNHRLNLAAADLRRTSHPLKETAEKYGFTDLSHFSRAFKKTFGRSPGEFRSPSSQSLI